METQTTPIPFLIGTYRLVLFVGVMNPEVVALHHNWSPQHAELLEAPVSLVAGHAESGLCAGSNTLITLTAPPNG